MKKKIENVGEDSFFEKVYTIVGMIPAGRVTSYSERGGETKPIGRNRMKRVYF